MNSNTDLFDKNQPLDFRSPFAEHMKTLMRSGRFGVNAAQKEVYAENNRLFRKWRDGDSAIGFGDYQSFLDGTKLYKNEFNVGDIGTVFSTTETGCINMDCVDLAEFLINKEYNPAILNLASATKPGGGYSDGLSAQEESLCRSSNLNLSLYQYGNPKYKNIRESGVTTREIGYPLNMNYGGIYTPNVTFFRYGKSNFYELRKHSFKCDVITVAALSFNGRSDYSDIDELSYRSANGGFTPEGEEIMLNKIRTIFRMGVEHGKNALVLGAFGCGAYKCPPDEVARQFRMVMEEPEFKDKFRLVVFAILESNRKPHGVNGKFEPFYREFGTYSI